ncbi:MAG: hypothetical protein ACE5FS_05275 [Paracoccaceae bacterium]
MNNRAAFWIAVCLVLAFGLDWLANGGDGTVFAGRQFWRLIDWMAFWR